MAGYRSPVDAEKLFLAHLGTAARAARLWGQGKLPVGVTKADLHGACLVAVWKAARNFDPDYAASRPATFETYASECCRRAIQRLVRIECRRGLTRVGDAARVTDPNYRHPAFAPFFAEDLPAKETADLREEIERVLGRLPARWAVVLRLRYLDGLTLRESAARLGVSYEAVRQMEGRAIGEARRWLTST